MSPTKKPLYIALLLVFTVFACTNADEPTGAAATDASTGAESGTLSAGTSTSTSSGATGTSGVTTSDPASTTNDSADATTQVDDDTSGGDETTSGTSGGAGDCTPAMVAADLGPRLAEFAIPTPASEAQWVTPSDDSIWFTETGTNKIGRATFEGVMTEYDIPMPGVAPKAISAGPGNAHWFIGVGFAGSVENNGQITMYELPAGADGAGIGHGAPGTPDVWYTDNGRQTVARLTLAGDVREFPVPYAGSELGDILLGPDGNLWVADRGTNRIVSLTPAGDFTQFDLPTDDAGLGALTRSASALWFTESKAGKIGQLALDGTFAEFDIPTLCAEPLGLTIAADGALWFTQRATNRIGRMTIDGTFTDDFAIPTADSIPGRITSKSNGTVWLLEAAGNNLVRIDPK